MIRFLILAALVIAAVVALRVGAARSQTDNGNMQCPSPSYATMTPTGEGCATNFTATVGGG